MMDMVQTAAVATANAVLPGSGILINSAFELGKICSEVAELLTGMQETASSIKTQAANIEKDVAYFRWVLQVLERVHHKSKLTTELQKIITRFETEVKEYDRVMKKFLEQNILKQLVFHSDLDTVSASVKETAGQLVQCVTTECAINGSVTYGHVDQSEERANRYMKFIDSPEVMKAMSDADNQKEILAIIARMGRRNEAMMQNPLETNDLVLNVMKEKLWASSSRAVQDEVKNLPDWYITEDEVDIDMSTIIGFGGDAKIYKGMLEDGTPVAVKVFNSNVHRSEAAKQKFFDTMKLWVRLSHFNNVCRFYGACYFTATPFIVMEYCDLGSLDKFLRQEGVGRCQASIDILTQAARAIIKMHSKGIVHGDLKCDNILVTGRADPQAKVCDFDRSFDWSALKSRRLVNGTAAEAGIEITDAVRYLAPECVEGMLPNSKSDVYSFGMTLYHALAGVSPYSDISCDEELRACKLARELPIRNVQSISDGAWKLITHCCDPAPDQRPTMDKVLEGLKSLGSQLPAIATLINAVVGVQADQITVLVSTPHAHGAPTKSPTLKGYRAIPRRYKIIGAVVLAVVIAGIAAGIVVGLKPSSSTSSSSTGSGSSADSDMYGSPLVNVSTILGDDSSSVPFSVIWGMVVAPNGSIYIADGESNIFQLTEDGVVSRLYDNFEQTRALALSTNGDLFVADYNVVQQVTSNDTLALCTADPLIWGIALDSSSNVYVAHTNLTKITPDGVVSTFATVTDMIAIAIDSSNNIYAAVKNGHMVLKFTPAGVMSVVAGSETSGFANGVGTSARFSSITSMAIGSDGDLYLADIGIGCIRKISLTTTEVSTHAGSCTSQEYSDGTGENARFDSPRTIAAAADGVFYVAEWTDKPRVRKLYKG